MVSRTAQLWQATIRILLIRQVSEPPPFPASFPTWLLYSLPGSCWGIWASRVHRFKVPHNKHFLRARNPRFSLQMGSWEANLTSEIPHFSLTKNKGRWDCWVLFVLNQGEKNSGNANIFTELQFSLPASSNSEDHLCCSWGLNFTFLFIRLVTSVKHWVESFFSARTLLPKCSSSFLCWLKMSWKNLKRLLGNPGFHFFSLSQ